MRLTKISLDSLIISTNANVTVLKMLARSSHVNTERTLICKLYQEDELCVQTC